MFDRLHAPRPGDGRPVHILLACMPKSGSTFLSDVISQLPGFSRALLVPVAGRREQELDEYCLQQADQMDYVSQIHVRHSDWTADMCREYGLRPVVLVRSLLDVVVSLRDHMRQESFVWPLLFAEAQHAEQDDAQLELMIARLAGPWFINFYMSWRKAPGSMMVAYETLVRDPTAVIAEVLEFSGAKASREEIEAAVTKVRAAGKSRLNVGVSGRGANLQPETVRALLELLDFYPEAASDPYFVALRAEGSAALAGASKAGGRPTFTTVVRREAQAPPHWAPRRPGRLFIRRVAPVLLLALAGLYWLLPRDLIPDATPRGYLDDCVVVMMCGVIAGRLTKFKGKAPRLRRTRASQSGGASAPLFGA